MSRLCNRAFATAKRVRTETDIGRGATSMSQVAVELVEKIFGDLKGRAILLVGAGKMGALSAKALAVARRGPHPRHEPLARARARARRAGRRRRSAGWDELPRLLVEADVVIVSTGAPTYVVTPRDGAAAR